MQTRMCFDDVAWEQSETISDAWVAELFKTDTPRAIGNLIVKHRKGTPPEICQPRAGAFNVSFRMKFEDGGSALIRFPKPGATMFPEEKVRDEVAVTRYIQEYISITVPFILHWGIKNESPLNSGPFIMIDHIDHDTDLGTALNTPTLNLEDPVLVNKNLQIVGVINWEFTYAAPVEYSHALPWWLLLEQPEYWPDGIDAWATAFETRLQTFLKVLTEREDIAMQQASRWEKRIELLSEEERQCMVLAVRQKLEQLEKRALAWEPEEVDTVEVRNSVV
ncbi:hypothetical protein P875_00138548 [Aspergillus parasiticus SU-1]|uniref:Aminoglycoside phosphotransferase domain-containing protein n=1 Tax=Aspergillus parasiticus (strain ATCC 56775 / NRRL 5862 / SRRC 143 / SU-1) TaxID=1403190 RepID=A0A0F0IAF5_ASPPU|nr:hypothetical protein P875_00138548 [Aspergillus parasiticus SU-1]